ncbi:MAG: 3-dehydroquinate synthase [Gammaproteobacteria bacterium CG11_big_fil_rev_8_21_14_0_20_46_22]|nr:MAG: 3-dehydroquinate synthase [Gammaproteobacteria bacterium CG12_big_fil_rev_8_21_14_0_65_46_12]PIR10722.1 MAG: 3-dehydroquinate synthase [Gammaproteobacteria bacterium CG11_big_fil_rev_8_21_14_0_20_46_22]
MSLRRIHIPTQSPYEVLIEPGLINNPQVIIETLNSTGAKRFVLISDDKLLALYAEPLCLALKQSGLTIDLVSFHANENTKTRETKVQLEDKLFKLACQRDTGLIALGGGITTDIVGFLAATYMRGIPVVYIPTTLLAMVDASVGGKTGVNTDHGKNTVGAFCQPSAVLIDPTVLSTLPKNIFCDGMAEVIKHALLADPELLALIENQSEAILNGDPNVLTPLIVRNVEIKRDFVIGDEQDKSLRQCLNLGHTIAHALEAESGFELSHGQAVAQGLILETAFGETLGITQNGLSERIRKVLAFYQLGELNIETIDSEKLITRMTHDKKNLDHKIHMVFIRDVGELLETKSITIDAAKLKKQLALIQN